MVFFVIVLLGLVKLGDVGLRVLLVGEIWFLLFFVGSGLILEFNLFVALWWVLRLVGWLIVDFVDIFIAHWVTLAII